MITGTTSLVGLLRDPKVGSLSPRMQNAAFAARALDVAYVPLGVAPERLEDAVRGLVALGFLGANVTTPHKRAAAVLCDEVEGGVESVNTLVIRDGRVIGSSTDTEALGRAPTEAGRGHRCRRRRGGMDCRARGARGGGAGLRPEGRVAAADR